MSNISVVIPLYNKAPHIKRAIESCRAQVVGPIEIIVVDDGSTDGGGKIVMAFDDPRIKLITQENQGVSVARNRGIQEVRGDLIAFLDADDTWDPQFLKEINSLQKKFPLAGAYATAWRIIGPDGLIRQRKSRLCQEEGQCLIYNYPKAAFTFPMHISAVTVPKQILIEVGGFCPGEYLLEDADLWVRIALHYPIAWSNAFMATYRQDAVNRALGIRRWSHEPALSRTARKALATEIPQEIKQTLKEYAAYYQLAAAWDCLVQGKKAIALQLLEYARGTQKFVWRWWQWRILAALPGNSVPLLWKTKNLFKSFICLSH